MKVIVFLAFNILLVNCDIITRLIRDNGYDAERYKFVTKDGYILTAHRIPPRNTSVNPEVVLLMHGILGSSADYVVSGRGKSLSSVLHEEGYDVWMLNNRGNRFSRAHERMSVSSPEYWDFSWHEIGSLDIPAAIDGVLERTGAKKLHYIGHSQGSAVGLVLLSERPEYNDKVASMHLLSPVAFFTNLRNPFLRLAAENLDALENTVRNEGLYELFSHDIPWIPVMQAFCGINSPFIGKCTQLLNMMVGRSDYGVDTNALLKLSEFDPAGTSAKQAIHFAQLIQSGNFQLFDYGKEKNFQKYKTATPPKYNLKNIKLPLNLYYANNDLLQSVQDAFKLHENLAHTGSKLYLIPGFNHVDYLISPYAKKLVYKRIVSIIKRTPGNAT